ncbi:putative disease resistance RPP13-like protein 1 [Henckelia pumila]|uniref:putative disease resistance RPP13-like protein 1 n=1 Tax=Henckelia pumila TaxID=405737 RepID=UPI003C6E92CA
MAAELLTACIGSAPFAFALERLASFGSYAWNEIKLILGVDDELRKLQRTMFMVQDLVDSVECSPLRFTRGSNAWKTWFEDIKKLSYDADALLDDISLHLSTFGSVGTAERDEVRKIVLSSTTLTLPHDINVLYKKLELLAKEMERLLMIESMKNRFSIVSPIHDFISTSSLIDENNVIGREAEQLACVINLLANEPEMGNFSVMSLVGMAGIGKTTLAKLVYNDDLVNSNFQKKMWVTVSMNFDLIKITKYMIEALTGNSCTLSDLNSVQVLLQESIRGFKFLLVLDDCWTENNDDWDEFYLPLRYGAKGSKIIVTTRSAKVSSSVRSYKTHSLQHLSDKHCWDLMKRRMLFSVEEQENLKSIGKEIAKKCKGLPLAAKTLGSLLSNSGSSEDQWLCILNSKLWNLPEDKIFPALMLSFLHLPPPLQKCFAYCSLFPKNHEFEVEELVLLWMAEGFIRPIEGMRLEDIGSKYFDDLYLRSFFEQDTNARNETVYKMHDLIHDMSQMVSSDICFQVIDMSDDYPLFGNTCHLSMLRDSLNPIHLKASEKNERLRTFLMINKNGADGGLLDNDFFSHLRSLRVLDLTRIGLSEFTISSSKPLKFLRYLNLSENKISRVPNSICHLLVLQTLKLKNCTRITALPEDTKNLSKLRHLDLDIKEQLVHMPPNFGRLTELQALSAFIVGDKKENGIAQISNMNSLRGSLCIKNMDQVTDVADAIEAKLHEKLFLDNLELQWVDLGNVSQGSLEQAQNLQDSVLANLRPHQNLKELAIKKYCGRFYPTWLSDPSRKITRIHLAGLKYCDSLPPLGQLPSLEFFCISNLPVLELIDENFYGTEKFPSLESFEVENMDKLINWEFTNTVDGMPRLQNFRIHGCPSLTNVPINLRSHPNLNISDCPNLAMVLP